MGRWSGWVLVGALGLWAGCFSPSFTSGQYRCGSADPPCPSGLTCVAGQCVQGDGIGPGTDGGGDVGGPFDGGGDVPSITDQAPVDQVGEPDTFVPPDHPVGVDTLVADAGGPEGPGPDLIGCTGLACGNTCVADPTTDSQNCGACGHDCLGGECKDSQCQPVVVASGLARPRSVYVDSGFAYVMTLGLPAAADSAILRFPLQAGAAAESLAEGEDTGAVGPHSLAAAGDLVFWLAQPAVVVRMLTIGSVAADLTAATNTPSSLAIDATVPRLVWSENASPGRIAAIDQSGTAASVVENQFVTVSVVAEDGNLYWANQGMGTGTGTGSIRTLAAGSATGTTPEILTHVEANPVDVAVNGGVPYWLNGDDGTLRTVDPATPNAPTTVESGLTGPVALVVDGANIYWLEGNGSVRRRDRQTGPPVDVATGLAKPSSIAQDDNVVVWLDEGTTTDAGVLYLLAK